MAGRCAGATAPCEIIRCTAERAHSGSASDLQARASVNGSSNSSEAATAVTCAAASASAGSSS
eukprot:scaffold515_cov101-Isochrysis_galbana.AAC.6